MIAVVCKDLIFSTKISGTARALGVPFQTFPGAFGLLRRFDSLLESRQSSATESRPTAENVSSSASAVAPTSVIVDLNAVDDEELAALGARIDAFRATVGSIPSLCFGSHVETSRLAAAERAGFNVLVRSEFTARLPELIGSFVGNGRV
jgi:hypothetical protein